MCTQSPTSTQASTGSNNRPAFGQQWAAPTSGSGRTTRSSHSASVTSKSSPLTPQVTYDDILFDDPGLVGFAVRPADDETIEDLVDRCFDTGYDPGPINDMSRQAPNGDLLAWVLTFPSSPTLPFIIDWGDTPLPSTTQPGGVELESFAVHHPLPFSVMGPLAALGLDIVVVAASRAALTATITGPGGSAEL